MEALWDSLIESPDALPLGDAPRAVLDQRLAAYEKEPAEGSPWHEVRARIQGADSSLIRFCRFHGKMHH